jgi:hypothetical protein
MFTYGSGAQPFLRSGNYLSLKALASKIFGKKHYGEQKLSEKQTFHKQNINFSSKFSHKNVKRAFEKTLAGTRLGSAAIQVHSWSNLHPPPLFCLNKKKNLSHVMLFKIKSTLYMSGNCLS